MADWTEATVELPVHWHSIEGGYIKHAHKVPPKQKKYPDDDYDPNAHTHLVVLSARNFINECSEPMEVLDL